MIGVQKVQCFFFFLNPKDNFKFSFVCIIIIEVDYYVSIDKMKPSQINNIYF